MTVITTIVIWDICTFLKFFLISGMECRCFLSWDLLRYVLILENQEDILMDSTGNINLKATAASLPKSNFYSFWVEKFLCFLAFLIASKTFSLPNT